MGTKTGIEWTDATWNPLRGCSRVSEGCRNCYAEKVAYRFSGAGQPYEGLAVLKNGHASWTGKVELVEKHLLDPLKWKPVFADCEMCGGGPNDTCMHGSKVSPLSSRWRPRRIFVNSMSDLFHESVPDEWLDRIFAVMALCPQHIFQVLTKRPQRMRDYIYSQQRSTLTARSARMQLTLIEMGKAKDAQWRWPLPNVWLGVSVENQAAADERIPLLLHTPAAVRFISAEPLLGPVRLDRVLDDGASHLNALAAVVHCDDAGKKALTGIDWVICGGESGPGARPMHPDWARGLRDECAASGVPFFFKQWGEWTPFVESRLPDSALAKCEQEMRGGTAMYRVGKHRAGALLDGVEHKAFPEVRA